MAESGSEDDSDAQSSGGEDPGCLAAFAVSPTPFEKISCWTPRLLLSASCANCSMVACSEASVLSLSLLSARTSLHRLQRETADTAEPMFILQSR